MSTLAFDSVEHIRRDVNGGRIIQATHAVGASMFFFAVYIHMFRGLYFGSYKAPREILWILGVHHLPPDDGDGVHGLRAALGPDELLGRDRDHQHLWRHSGGRRADPAAAARRLRGRQPTLNRFFSLHYLLPFIIAAVVAPHLGAARAGQQQPDRRRSEVEPRHGAVPPVLHDEGRVRDGGVPASRSRGSCSSRRTCWATRTTTSWPTRW
jgi:hypothetical protein